MKSLHNIDANLLHCLINLECCIEVNGNFLFTIHLDKALQQKNTLCT